MAKREQILRLMFLAELFKRKENGISYEDARDYLVMKFEEKGSLKDFKFSEKTFKRDRETLQFVLGLDIGYRRSTNSYKILDEELEETESVLDNILLLDAYRQVKSNRDVMVFEKRKPRGLHLLNGLLHAIQNRKTITLLHTKFWEGIPHKKVLEPYALKEFNYRWYLLANEKDGKDFFLKTFGLDRISDLEISNSSFVRNSVNIDEIFKNSFGIISTLNEKPEEIVLSFNSEQGNYIKSFPLHTSQRILLDNEEELRIQLTIAPTYDFEREILSHGKNVKVISPESLRERIMKETKNSLENYN